MNTPKLNLKHTTLQALFTADGLADLDARYLAYLDAVAPDCHVVFSAWRKDPQALSGTGVTESALLIEAAQVLDAFLIELFGIESAAEALRLATLAHDPVHYFHTEFVQKRAKRALRQFDPAAYQDSHAKLLAAVPIDEDHELAVARYAADCLRAEDAVAIEALVLWCLWAMTTEAGQAYVADWVSFVLPSKTDYDQLVPLAPVTSASGERVWAHAAGALAQRDGFGLTDPRMTQRAALSTMHYCVDCHGHAGDFCSKGFPVKKQAPELGVKVGALGDPLSGCPLDQKISQMHVLKKAGYGLGALAMITIDNPMCAATGHRICNDCMNACIYQKQTPVDVPQSETRILSDVLALPWGVELYDLLIRWNPLRREQPYPKPYQGLKVLVMGMGPAGFSLAHHLLMEGCAVVGADGLKIEPLPAALLHEPIYDFEAITSALDERVMAGFGGVAEYGITVRWDKNFLRLIYLSLMRRPHFQVFGDVRFGGTVTVMDAWALGFDHLALALGAGLPRELRLPNSLAPGMRQANDFLMALQLTGAAKKDSVSNLQIRLPAVVIGGGLTGVDTATELQAYYIVQVEKIHQRYHALIEQSSAADVRRELSAHDCVILDEFLAHGEQVVRCRAEAEAAGVQPDFTPLIHRWGGVTIVYRKRMQDSPAYRRNHAELTSALSEGVFYLPALSPTAVQLDETGHVLSLACDEQEQTAEGTWQSLGTTRVLPARAILVATGAQPNIAYAYEHQDTFARSSWSYTPHQSIAGVLHALTDDVSIKSQDIGVFTSYAHGRYRVSFVGDTHPVAHGSVVKAIASAKKAYGPIMSVMAPYQRAVASEDYDEFAQQITDYFRTTLIAVTQVAPHCTMLRVRSQAATRHYHPGQFYRLQLLETQADRQGGTTWQSETAAMLGVMDPDQPNELRFYLFDQGVSSRLLSQLTPGDALSLMGPTGAALRTAGGPGDSLLVIGGLMAIPYVLAFSHATRASGKRLCFVAVAAEETLGTLAQEIASACDVVRYIDEISGLVPAVRSLPADDLAHIQEVITMASDALLATVREDAALRALFPQDVRYVGSVYGPMQCMLKGVCGQCLQFQIDPETGERTKAVYACSWQHQPMDKIDIPHLEARLSQNSLQESLSRLWQEAMHGGGKGASIKLETD